MSDNIHPDESLFVPYEYTPLNPDMERELQAFNEEYPNVDYSVMLDIPSPIYDTLDISSSILPVGRTEAQIAAARRYQDLSDKLSTTEVQDSAPLLNMEQQHALMEYQADTIDANYSMAEDMMQSPNMIESGIQAQEHSNAVGEETLINPPNTPTCTPTDQINIPLNQVMAPQPDLGISGPTPPDSQAKDQAAPFTELISSSQPTLRPSHTTATSRHRSRMNRATPSAIYSRARDPTAYTKEFLSRLDPSLRPPYAMTPDSSDSDGYYADAFDSSSTFDDRHKPRVAFAADGKRKRHSLGPRDTSPGPRNKRPRTNVSSMKSLGKRSASSPNTKPTSALYESESEDFNTQYDTANGQFVSQKEDQFDDNGVLIFPIAPVNDPNHKDFVSQKERGSYQQNNDGDMGIHPKPQGPPPAVMQWGQGLAGYLPHGRFDNPKWLARHAGPKKSRGNTKGRTKMNVRYAVHDVDDGDDSSIDYGNRDGPGSPVLSRKSSGSLSRRFGEKEELGGYASAYSHHPRQAVDTRLKEHALDEGLDPGEPDSGEEDIDLGDEYGIVGTRTFKGTNAGLRGFSRPNEDLLPSKDSGYVIHHKITNVAPKMVPTETVTDAQLAKRGIERGSAPMIAKRAHGVNDPDNIFIVNTYENNATSWGRIADELNKKAIAQGREPKFSANAVQNRYNRNAPLIFAAEGKRFIPLKQRSDNKKKEQYAPQWTPDLDTILVETVKEIDSRRWSNVADLFNSKTGEHINERAAASRHMFI